MHCSLLKASKNDHFNFWRNAFVDRLIVVRPIFLILKIYIFRRSIYGVNTLVHGAPSYPVQITVQEWPYAGDRIVQNIIECLCYVVCISLMNNRTNHSLGI